jgi:O-antigen/teichoic acid export membrane protein
VPRRTPLVSVSDQTRIREDELSGDDVRRRAASGLATMGLRSVLVRALGLVGNVVLARLLSPSEFGAIAFGYALVVLGGFLSTGGLAASLVSRKEPPRKDELQAVVALQLLLTLTSAAIVAGIGLFAGTPAYLAAVMMLSLPLDVLKGGMAIGLERGLNYRPLAQVEVLEIISYNVIAVALVVAGAGVWGVAVAAVSRAVVGITLLRRASAYGLVGPRWHWAAVRPLLGFGARFQASGLVTVARDQGLNLLIGAVSGIATLGVWSVAWRLLQTVYLLFDSLLRVLFPAMSRLLEQDESQVGPLLGRGLRLATLCTGFAVVPLIGCADILVHVIFGAKWSETATVLPWAAAGLLIGGPAGASLTGYLFARGDASTVLRVGVAQAAIWLGVTAALLPVLGVKGIGIAMLASSAAELVLYERAVRGTTGLNVISAIAPVSACALAAGGLGLALQGGLHDDVLSLVALGALTEAAFLVLIVVTGSRPALQHLVRVGRLAAGRA